MLDIKFIRDNPQLVAEKSRQKGYEVDIPKLLKMEKEYRATLEKIQKIAHQRNLLTAESKGKKPEPEQIEKGRALRNQEQEAFKELDLLYGPFTDEWKKVPNMPADDVPVGASEAENVVAKEWGTKPKFDFEPKTHWDLAEGRGLIDKERAAKVSGARFAYIKGDLARLQFALIQFVLNTLTSEAEIKKIADQAKLNVSTKPFVPVLPPAMVRTEVYDAMDRLEPREDRYQVGPAEDDLWLQGSAEHTLGPMYKDEILPAEELPIRYLGYATSFRREAGTYGKDTEGIIRMHQFDKLEMESFARPEDGLNEHLLLVAIQEYLMQQLGLPYRTLQKCTADIGKPNARGIDIEVWLPGQGRYLETHTADFMTDYQSRRLQTRIKREASGDTEFVHTNDATAFAMGRALVAIIENNQTADGKIQVPKVLQPYMNGQTEL